MMFAQTPVRHVGVDAFNAPDPERWPATLPPMRQVVREGLEPGRATATLVEVIAMACGVNGERGSSHAMRHSRPTESDLHSHLRLTPTAGSSKYGYFLRTETMHGFYTYLQENPSTGLPDHDLLPLSPGESFLEWIPDEPASALSLL